MSGTPRPRALHKLEKKLGKATEEDALVKAVILTAEVLEEGGHGDVLVRRLREVLREAAAGGNPCHLPVVACGCTNAGDPGTFESVANVVSWGLCTAFRQSEMLHVQVEGKVARNRTNRLPELSWNRQFPSPTPSSPLEARTLPPRTAICANRLHACTA